jgi:hypothetical protein
MAAPVSAASARATAPAPVAAPGSRAAEERSRFIREQLAMRRPVAMDVPSNHVFHPFIQRPLAHVLPASQPPTVVLETTQPLRAPTAPSLATAGWVPIAIPAPASEVPEPPQSTAVLRSFAAPVFHPFTADGAGGGRPAAVLSAPQPAPAVATETRQPAPTAPAAPPLATPRESSVLRFPRFVPAVMLGDPAAMSAPRSSAGAPIDVARAATASPSVGAASGSRILTAVHSSVSS